jgi:hypothetical protein
MSKVKGLDSVVGKLKLTLEAAKNEKTEKAITEMLYLGGSFATDLTPIDQGNLIRTQGRQTWNNPNGWAGAVFYKANYAGWVNSMPGKLKGQPRAHFGKTGNHSKFGPQEIKEFGGGSLTGNYWDPDAEPHFLEKGMEKMAAQAQDILKKNYSV